MHPTPGSQKLRSRQISWKFDFHGMIFYNRILYNYIIILHYPYNITTMEYKINCIVLH